MAEHLTKVVTDALHRFGEHITRVEAHIADENSHVKANPDAQRKPLIDDKARETLFGATQYRQR